MGVTKIKMIASMSGADFTLQPGDVTDRFGAAENVRLINAGFATPYVDKPVTEKAVKAPATEKRRKAGA